MKASNLVFVVLLLAACGDRRSTAKAPFAGPPPTPIAPYAPHRPPPPPSGAPVPIAVPAATSPTPFLDARQLAVGDSHVCAVTRTNEIVCWGDNAAGQLGVGLDGRAVAASLPRPHRVGGLPPIASVAAGTMHTCAIDAPGAVFCWGSAGGDLVVTNGGLAGSIQLADPKLGTPARMPLGAGAAHLVAIANKGSEACVAFADDVRCWNTFGAIPLHGRPATPLVLTTTKHGGVTAIAIGHGKVCAVASGQVSCWRRDVDPTPAVRARGDTTTPASIAIGESHACVASTTGELRCWESLIDDFWKKPPTKDVRWKGKSPTRAVAVGDSPVCTVDGDGRVDCFLSEEHGLTDDAIARSWATAKIAPHPIAGVDHAIALGLGLGRNIMGYGFGCALRETPDAEGAAVCCWGDNESGQLGDGSSRSSRTAVRVKGWL